MQEIHRYLMQEALVEAEKAREAGEVPVGAVISDNDSIIARGHNLIETNKDATAHAEIIVIREASNKLNNWRLNSLILCVTLEPCIMCMGAIQNSRIGKVIFGAWDKVAGACGSVSDLTFDQRAKKKIVCMGGIEEEKCVNIIKGFFKERRERWPSG